MLAARRAARRLHVALRVELPHGRVARRSAGQSSRSSPQLFLFLTLVGSVAWLDLLITSILELVSLWKVLSGLSDLIFGVTVVSIGNTFPGSLG